MKRIQKPGGFNRALDSHRALFLIIFSLLAIWSFSLTIGAASAHGFSSVAYASVSSGDNDLISVELKLEYDLLIVSAADTQKEDALFQEGTEAFESRDLDEQSTVLNEHSDTVMAYVTDRFTVSTPDQTCVLGSDGPARSEIVEGVPYGILTLEADCPETNDGHVITSNLFPDEEGYVRDTKTIVSYDLDLQNGSAALDKQTPSVSTQQSTWERFWSFFVLGAEHLLGGIDHVLFLLALIVGSRRLREVVLAATAFTVAHSVTFILAATGLISVPASVIEPVIAISIAIVSGWYLFKLWRKGAEVDTFDTNVGALGLDRSGWFRLGVIFLFGLVHGLGFAAALGIDEPWSWTLLWSLLVFNVGIEAVQIGLILIIFPILVLLRRRAPRTERWISAIVAAVVTLFGLVWFVQRIFEG